MTRRPSLSASLKQLKAAMAHLRRVQAEADADNARRVVMLAELEREREQIARDRDEIMEGIQAQFDEIFRLLEKCRRQLDQLPDLIAQVILESAPPGWTPHPSNESGVH